MFAAVRVYGCSARLPMRLPRRASNDRLLISRCLRALSAGAAGDDGIGSGGRRRGGGTSGGDAAAYTVHGFGGALDGVRQRRLNGAQRLSFGTATRRPTRRHAAARGMRRLGSLRGSCGSGAPCGAAAAQQVGEGAVAAHAVSVWGVMHFRLCCWQCS